MKRVVLMLSLVAALLLSACGLNGGGSKESSADGSGSKGKKTLELWQIDPGEKEKVYKEAVARFEKKHPDVKVKFLTIPNDAYKQKLSVAMSGNRAPDVFTSWGGGWLKNFVDQDKVLDITADTDKEHFNKLALDNSTYDNKVYGLPLGLSVDVIFYNKEIFKKYGLTPPKTYDEWLKVIDTLNKNDIIPLALANKTKWPGAYYFMNFASRVGGTDLFDSALHRTGKTFDDPAYVKAGELIQEMVKKKAFNSGFNGIPYDEGQSRQLMYSGKAAMMDMSLAFVNNMKEEAPDFASKLDFFIFPNVKGGKGNQTNLGASASPVWSVAKNSKNQKLATELAKEMTSTETAKAYVERTGSLTSVDGVAPKDEMGKRFYEAVSNATHLQMPYDQTLPPELAELHKDTTQAVFGLDMTPKEAAEKMEQKAKQDLKKE
ncbi:extracellular solute-binding protein [Fictibacillus enclensis]|uniref:extracellular solute-binding protein n=1 Tax=Fictibacillus enclensis TaxID=1017270 RepID=UPI0025A1021F|nr:extracellular solute-binding protein [Fictibacillus enclensis]MDM5340396.1 extracellular solute-binding protein [Fictibacillus enclensis]